MLQSNFKFDFFFLLIYFKYYLAKTNQQSLIYDFKEDKEQYYR